MSDGIVIPLDVDDTKAKGKIARLKKDAGQAGKALGQASSQAARVGGAGGGALARGIGGFQQGTGAGVLGLGLAGGGMLLSSFLQRDGERMTMAKDREARIQARAADARSVMKSKDDMAAGGLNFLGAARRIISSGADKNRVQGAISGGKRAGLGAAESLASMEASDATGVSMQDIQTGIATGQMGTDPMAVAQNIQKYNGLHNALAATLNVSTEEAGNMISRTLTDVRSGKLNRAGSALSPVEQAQLDALMGGDTARVLENQARDTLDPGRKLMLDASQKAMDTVNQLQAAAASQSALGAILAEMGRVVGLSNGAATRELEVGATAAGGG
jgi:hypothetical protein